MNKGDEESVRLDPTSAATGSPETGRGPVHAVLHYLPWMVLALSLLVSLLAWNAARAQLDQARHEYFNFRVREAINRIEQRMQAYQQVLLGVAGLFESSVSVERHEFKTYVDTLKLSDHYPGIQGVGFSLIVPPSDKAKHIEAIRKEGFPGYDIHPEGARNLYTSIIYLEPFAGRNLRAFGYDMYSEPVRRAAMEEARDNGRMAMSGKVRLVQETGVKEQAGFLVYLPIYRNFLPHDTLEQRLRNIVGWTYAPFRADDLMEGIHGELASDLDIEVYDNRDVRTETLVHDSDGTASAVLSTYEPLRSRTVVEIAGHPWTIHVRALKGIHTRVDSHKPVTFAGIGLMISLLLTWLTRVLVTGRERAMREVQEREKLIGELKDALSQIKTLQGILPICSVCKKIRDDHDAWRQMETYISEHSGAMFSHGYCPDCYKKMMLEIGRL